MDLLTIAELVTLARMLTELVRAADEASELIERDPENMGGVAVFAGTRVPVEFLFEFLEDDQTLETFLDQYPAVSRAQARGVLGASRELLLRS